MLEKLTSDNIDCVHEIAHEHIIRSGGQDRTTADYCVASLQVGIVSEGLAVWVDDTKKPTLVLVVSQYKNLLLDENTVMINNIYIRDPKDPDVNEKFKIMLDTAEAYARQVSADTIMGASWVYNKHRGIQSLWKRHGYKIQEVHNCKKLS